MVIFRYLPGTDISMSSAFAVSGVISARGTLVAQWWGFQLVWLDKLYSCLISIQCLCDFTKPAVCVCQPQLFSWNTEETIV